MTGKEQGHQVHPQEGLWSVDHVISLDGTFDTMGLPVINPKVNTLVLVYLLVQLVYFLRQDLLLSYPHLIPALFWASLNAQAEDSSQS